MKIAHCADRAGGQPVDHHLPDAFLHDFRRLVVRRQRMPVGDEKVALVFLLQPDPVLQRAVVVADVHAAGRTHPG
jgi:hypothetical protein